MILLPIHYIPYHFRVKDTNVTTHYNSDKILSNTMGMIGLIISRVFAQSMAEKY